MPKPIKHGVRTCKGYCSYCGPSDRKDKKIENRRVRSIVKRRDRKRFNNEI
jgi:biotin synthase-like enzyme